MTLVEKNAFIHTHSEHCPKPYPHCRVIFIGAAVYNGEIDVL
jgi:hypothetical protein